MMRTLRSNPFLFISAFFMLLILSLCLLAPWITSYPLNEFDLKNIVKAPSLDHLMGTDHFGRDIFTRFLFGGRVTLRITLIGTLVSFIAIPLGLLGGYFKGWADLLLSRFFDALSVLPPLLLIVFTETLLGYGEGYYQYALGLAFMPPLYRLTRTLTINISGREYVDASRVMGASSWHILTRHILRNILPELLTQIFSTFSDILIYCTIIGYLGIGVKSPTPEWGAMIHEMFAFVHQNPLSVVFSCVILSLLILSLNLFGRFLRDHLSHDRISS